MGLTEDELRVEGERLLEEVEKEEGKPIVVSRSARGELALAPLAMVSLFSMIEV